MEPSLVIMGVKPISRVSYWDVPTAFQHVTKSHYGYEPPKTKMAEVVLAHLEVQREEIERTHAENLSALETNQAIRDQITALMTQVGIKETYSAPDPKSRARSPKWIPHSAGYVSDIQRLIKCDDGYESALRALDSFKLSCEKYLESAMHEAELEKSRKERENQELLERRAADLEVVRTVDRYQLPLTSSWDDIYKALRKRDKYLYLGMTMLDTRGDFSRGDEVAEAFGEFKVTTIPIDLEIEEDISQAISYFNDCQDGRVFRDTLWNYDALFTLVANRQLLVDTLNARMRVESL